MKNAIRMVSFLYMQHCHLRLSFARPCYICYVVLLTKCCSGLLEKQSTCYFANKLAAFSIKKTIKKFTDNQV